MRLLALAARVVTGDEGHLDEPAEGMGTVLDRLPIEQQIAYWKRRARTAEQHADNRAQQYERHREDADRWREHERTSTPELVLERAKAAGRADAWAAAHAETAAGLLSMALRGRGLAPEHVEAVLKGVRLDAFVGNDGVDRGAIAAYVDAVAPASTTATGQRGGP